MFPEFLVDFVVKNIVFDLAGVVFHRDRKATPEYLVKYFSFINAADVFPSFWHEYDLGNISIEDVARALADYNGGTYEEALENVQTAVEYQQEILPTKELIKDLKIRGYKLYVLSNMSKEYIEFLRKMEVYSYFDGDVISCFEHLQKPDAEIYQILLERFSLDPADTFFIDDREPNIKTAEALGINAFLFDRDDPEASCLKLRELLLK